MWPSAKKDTALRTAQCQQTKKSSLLKEHYALQSKKGTLSALGHNTEAQHALQGTGRYFAKLADTVDVIVNGDYEQITPR